jgi:hypothetical protein
MILPPICSHRKCKHYRGITGSEDTYDERSFCDAFPNGIPEEILAGVNLHETPLAGQQNNIVYEKEQGWQP